MSIYRFSGVENPNLRSVWRNFFAIWVIFCRWGGQRGARNLTSDSNSATSKTYSPRYVPRMIVTPSAVVILNPERMSLPSVNSVILSTCPVFRFSTCPRLRVDFLWSLSAAGVG